MTRPAGDTWPRLDCSCGSVLYGTPAAVVHTWTVDHATHRVVKTRRSSLDEVVAEVTG